MKTIILPGYSPINKEWAEETKENIKSTGDVDVIYWDHWTTGFSEGGWIDSVVDQLISKYTEEKINIIAKSIGTVVALKLLERDHSLVNKLLLCGIPLTDITEGDINHYQSLKYLSLENILCIQNQYDPHGNFQEAERLIRSVDENINIISMPRDDHHYPYYNEFIKFLGR